MLYKNRRPIGFTMLELLIAAAVSSLIAIVVFSAFRQSSAAISQGTAKMSAQQRCRLAVDRITPLVMSAVTVGGVDAITRPAAGGALDDRIIFTTTEDFLNPAYDPEAVFSLGTVSPETHSISLDTTTGRLIFQKWDLGANAPDTTFTPRQVGHGITVFETRRFLTQSIEVRLVSPEEWKNAAGDTAAHDPYDPAHSNPASPYSVTVVLEIPTELSR